MDRRCTFLICPPTVRIDHYGPDEMIVRITQQQLEPEVEEAPEKGEGEQAADSEEGDEAENQQPNAAGETRISRRPPRAVRVRTDNAVLCDTGNSPSTGRVPLIRCGRTTSRRVGRSTLTYA
ncbi:MAG: hypothetical protein WKH64_08115 [Chloroflexia bacterium]